jgi:hypothetical protein
MNMLSYRFLDEATGLRKNVDTVMTPENQDTFSPFES